MAAVDLEELERKARAATPGEWWMSVEDGDICAGEEGPEATQVGAIYLGVADTEHVLANSPPVTLALIARINELEIALRSVAHDGKQIIGILGAVTVDEILARGVVLP